MRILGWLALVTLVACGGSKHPANAPPDTRQVTPWNDGAPGDDEHVPPNEVDKCCCQVAHVPPRYQMIWTAACIDGSGRVCSDWESCKH